MSEVQHIRSLVREAALYHAQGLLAESRGKYEEILSFLGSNKQFQNIEELTEAVKKRLQNVESDMHLGELRDRVLECSQRASSEYNDPLIDCAINKGYNWIKGGMSWTRKRITNLRLKGGLPGKKRIWS